VLADAFGLGLCLYARLKVTKRETLKSLPEGINSEPKYDGDGVISLNIPDVGEASADNPVYLQLNVDSFYVLEVSKDEWVHILLSKEFFHFLSVNMESLKRADRTSLITGRAEDYRRGRELAVIPDQGLEVSENDPLPVEIYQSPEWILYFDSESAEKLKLEFQSPSPSQQTTEKYSRIPTPPNTTWNMIRIKLNANESGFLVFIKNHRQDQEHVDQVFGEYFRTKNTGNWNDQGQLLIDLCKNNGKLTLPKYEDADRQKKSRCSQKLKQIFSINEEPFTETEQRIFRAKFTADSE
jgi:hypothetical protein